MREDPYAPAIMFCGYGSARNLTKLSVYTLRQLYFAGTAFWISSQAYETYPPILMFYGNGCAIFQAREWLALQLYGGNGLRKRISG